MSNIEAGASRTWVRGGRIICPESDLDATGSLILRDGLIEGFTAEAATPGGHDVIIEAEGQVVAPGLVDLHAHLGEPGFEHKEDLVTAGRAAAHGGFTTVLAAPDTDPVNDTRATTEFIMRRAEAAGIRVLPMATLTRQRAGKHLTDMFDLRDGGAVAFGEGDKPLRDTALLRRAMEYAKAVGLPIFEFPEEPGLARAAVMHEGPISTRLGLRGVPGAAEQIIVDRAIALSRLTGCPVHLGPVSTGGAVAAVARARAEGVQVSCAVTATHLSLTDAAVAEAYDSNLRIRPPLREEADRQALIAGVASGAVVITSGHRPQSPVEKQVEFELAAPGVAALETTLSQTLALVEAGALSLPAAIRALTAGPAAVIGQQAGTLKAGRPADLVVVATTARWHVSTDRLSGRAKNTPLLGATLPGVVTRTLVGGRAVWQQPTSISERADTGATR